MSKVLSNKAMSLMAASHTVHDKISWDALWDYIAELEAANQAAVLGRIAELEKKVDQILYEIEIPNKYSLRDSERFTVHSDIERQDDKSPNDTQTQTFVYRKEDEK